MTSKAGLIPLPFAGGYYRSRSRSFNDKRLINWYVSYPDEAGIGEYQLLPTPGIREIEELGIIGARGAKIMNGKLYVVGSYELYRIDYSAGVYSKTVLNSLANPIFEDSDSPRVVMAANKNQLVIVVPGYFSYLYTEGGALVEITDPEFLVADTVVAIDSYFVFSQTGTNTIFSSDLNNGAAYSALNRYIVSQLQKVVGVIVYRNQLYAMGSNLIIPFSNNAELYFSFRPVQNAAIDVGVEGKFLSINMLKSFAFVGRSVNSGLSVWLYSSGVPQQISTEPIDYILNKFSQDEISNAFLMQHSEAGSEFLTLTINLGQPENSYCFVYDLIASRKSGKPEWHERRTVNRGSFGGEYNDGAWNTNCIVNAYGKNIAFGYSPARAGVIDDSIGTELGNKVVRILNTQPFTVMGVNTKVKSLEVYTDSGVDDGNSPLTLSWSDDGGFNYGNKLSRSPGAVGDYGRRLTWNQLGGFSRQRMLRLEYSGEYPRAINKMMANIE